MLAAWDGRSEVDSVGTHLFQEFWKRAQHVPGLWQMPFDAADPIGTPRDLDETNPMVVQAMSDALAFLDEQQVAPDAPWGSLQVAGDDDAPPIPIGGGGGFAGVGRPRVHAGADPSGPGAPLPGQRSGVTPSHSSQRRSSSSRSSASHMTR